jgi:hypothetical protein
VLPAHNVKTWATSGSPATVLPAHDVRHGEQAHQNRLQHCQAIQQNMFVIMLHAGSSAAHE